MTTQETSRTGGIVEGDGGMDLANLFSVDRSNRGMPTGDEVSAGDRLLASLEFG